jgi:hypothetical protein
MRIPNSIHFEKSICGHLFIYTEIYCYTFLFHAKLKKCFHYLTKDKKSRKL